jgi:uncharacterized lipoprotein YmbA
MLPAALNTLTGCLSLAGCFSLSRPTPPVEHFVLGGARPPEVQTASRASIAVGVRRLQLTPYLRTPFIVVRRGAQRITFSEFHRWGEDLGEGINHTLAYYLASRVPYARLDVAPWPLATQHDYLIELRVLQFEGLAPDEGFAREGEARLLATWQIIRQEDGEVVGQGSTDFRQAGWTVGDYAALVALLDSGLDALATELATDLERLNVRKS